MYESDLLSNWQLRRMQEMLSKLQQEVQRPPTNGHSNVVNGNGKNGTK
jgi:hypothetical protein